MVAILIPFSFWYVSPDWSKLFSARAWQHLVEVAQAAFPPDFGAPPLSKWLSLAATTLAMSLLVENLDDRPLVALKSLGASGGAVFTYGVLPPTFPRFVGYLLYRWEEIIRATVVVGLIGAGGLGWLLTEQLSSFDYSGVLATLIIFVGLIFLVDMISNAVRRAFRET